MSANIEVGGLAKLDIKRLMTASPEGWGDVAEATVGSRSETRVPLET